MPELKVRTTDGTIFRAEYELIRASIKLQSMIEDDESLVDAEEIHSIPVTLAMLKKVNEWAVYHKNDPVGLKDPSQRGTKKIPKWDSKFLNVDQDTLFQIILAAYHLEMPRLIDVSCQVVANMMGGKTPEELRKLFNIKNDVNDDEPPESHEAHEESDHNSLSDLE